MEIGLHIADFTFPGGLAGLRDDLTRIVTTAEEAGFEKVSVMDHLWQIGFLGPPEHEMLEAYTRRCRSVCRCGARTTARTTASTTSWRGP
jgi:uncharacterized radical SAM superfamily Fe-S cluster-containing enzyme